jgi:four helix bundle protein
MNYRDLIAWQKAMDLVELVYRVTKCFPSEERFGLTNQARRASVSIPSNIAEGQGRRTTGEFRHFLSVAYGSLRELETQILIGQRLGFITNDAAAPVLDLAGEVGRLINGLSESLPE